MTLASEVIQHYAQAGRSLALAESCTGGMIAAALTDIPGSSAVLDSSLVTYDNQAKIDLLGVREETLKNFGAVSEETAIEMVTGLLARRPVDVGLSVTGIAGPGGATATKPLGRVNFCIKVGGTLTPYQEDFGDLSRLEIRTAATEFALMTLLKALTSER